MSDAGRILIFTGDGKGKTTAALGMVLRAHGHGIPVAVIQFVKSDTRPLKIAIPPRAGHFLTLRLLASLQRRNSRFALKQSSLRTFRCGGRGPRKISNARFRDPISKLRKGLDTDTGEFAALQKMAGVEIIVTGLGFVPRPTDPRFADHCRAAEKGLRIAAEAAFSGCYGLVVLDEVCTAVALKLLAEENVLAVIRDAAPGVTVVLTGRGATEGLIQAADTVSEVRCIKHGFYSGRKAQKGVEF